MLVGDHKQGRAWKARTYPVPTPSRHGLRWKASALRGLRRYNTDPECIRPVTIMVPALYNFMPAEAFALGWFNEIEALVKIRQRMMSAAKLTGWDTFTFHTLHNADHFFDTAISTVRETLVKEGSLSAKMVRETTEQFAKAYDYHRIDARLVESLVFQTSLWDWLRQRAADVPLRFHVVGTALLSALVSSGSIAFNEAVRCALAVGARWDDAVRNMANGKTEDETGWSRFQQVRRLIAGRSSLSLGVAWEDLPKPDAPSQPFSYSPTAQGEPMLITTAQDAAHALETLNLASWSQTRSNTRGNADEPIRGWLVSPLHRMAPKCRWSLSNHLLSTPDSISLFLDHIATLGRKPVLLQSAAETAQNRLRLSRIKVTGP